MRYFTLIILLSLSNIFYSQDIVYDDISMGAGYENMLFYSLENGLVAEAPMDGWDISFDVRSMGSSIRINGGMGHSLYYYGTLDEWDTVSLDNLDMSNQLRNKHNSWSLGAFTQFNDPDNDFDLGWGIYDIITHIVTGDKVFVLMLPTGEYKKITIISLASGVYTFKYADINGENEYEIEIAKNDFSGKLQAYFNLSSNQILDYEPEESWDFLFTRYVEDLGNEYYYGVTGVLNRHTIGAYQADNLFDPFVDQTFDETLLNDSVNCIGYDWKEYSMGSGYSLIDDRCYFVYDDLGMTWRVVFTGFEGMSTGNIQLGKIKLESSSTNDLKHNYLTIYPNPASQEDHIQIKDISEIKSIRVISSNGNTVFHKDISGLTSYIYLPQLESGLYIVEYLIQNQRKVDKLVVQ